MAVVDPQQPLFLGLMSGTSADGIASKDGLVISGGTITVKAADDGIRWPDTATFTPGGDLLFTASNLNQHFAGAVQPGQERYELWRLKLSPHR